MARASTRIASPYIASSRVSSWPSSRRAPSASPISGVSSANCAPRPEGCPVANVGVLVAGKPDQRPDRALVLMTEQSMDDGEADAVLRVIGQRHQRPDRRAVRIGSAGRHWR
jgi:hypothetical protein